MLEVAIHHFDMLRFISGSDVKSVYARGWNPAWSDLEGLGSAFVLLDFENGFRANYSVTEKSIGFPTGYQCDWIMQTDKGASSGKTTGRTVLICRWTSMASLSRTFISPAKEQRRVWLEDVKRQLREETGCVPTVFDNIRSLAVSFAVLRSVEEDRPVEVSEILGEM